MADLINPIIQYEIEQDPLKVRMSNGAYVSGITQYHEIQDYNGVRVPRVDNWIPDNEQQKKLLFKTFHGVITAPVREYYKYTGENNTSLNTFITSTKKCYNSEQMRDHMCKYLNYFELYFDTDGEYFSILCHLKFIIDDGICDQNGVRAQLTEDHLVFMMKRMLLSSGLVQKTADMVEHNYSLSLDYKNINNPSLQYTDTHAKRLMQCSILINLFIPILTHFAWMQKMTTKETDLFLLKAFDPILSLFTDVDIVNKLYETANTNISKSEQGNAGIWIKQDIRGRNVTTHSISSIENIILNIMPKYVFCENIVSMNYSSIINNTSFQILDIEFEYNFIPLSSSKKDEDNMSELD